MSNPLRWFRKYEKLMLGVFGVLLMIAFTFSMGVSGLDFNDWAGAGGRAGGGGGGDTGNPVVVTWKKGDVTEADFQDLRTQRNVLLQFSQILLQQTQASGGQPLVSTIPRDRSDEALMQLLVLESKADEMGISISNEAVVDYLIRLTDGRVPRSEFKRTWDQMTRRQWTEQQLIALLRRELKAMHVHGMMQSGNFPISPLRRWDFYNRLERSVDAELMQIPVDEYLADVPEPTDEEIVAFYDKYKHQYQVPGSSEPGFKQRDQAAFEYVKLSYDDYFQDEINSVSDEDVKKYYEENKDEFRQQEFLDDDLNLNVPGSPAVPSVPAVPGDDTSPPTPSADGQPSTDDPSATMSTDTEPAADSAAAEKADAKPAGDQATPSDPSSEEAAAPENSTTPNEPPAPAPSPEPQSEESTEPAAETSTPAESADSSKTAAETADESAASQSAEKAASEPMESLAGDQESDASESDPADETKPDDTKPADALTKYKPVESVADEIKRSLARPLAQERMNNALVALKRKIDLYYRQHVKRQMEQSEEEIPLPDLSDVDSPTPLEIQSTPLHDSIALSETELGSAYDIDFSQGGLRQIVFSEIAFVNKNIQPYQASVFPTSDGAPTRFLYWRTESRDAYVPELSEIREQVIAELQLDKAADLALAAAEECIPQAQESDKPLADAINQPGRKFFEANNVTWMTGGNVPLDRSSVPHLSEIAGVDAGDDFYRRLFTLGVGEVGVAFDRPKKHAFVMRVTSQSPDLDIRREGFFENADLIPGIFYLVQAENRRGVFLAYQDVLKEYDVEWQREPRSGAE